MRLIGYSSWTFCAIAVSTSLDLEPTLAPDVAAEQSAADLTVQRVQEALYLKQANTAVRPGKRGDSGPGIASHLTTNLRKTIDRYSGKITICI